MRVLMIKPNEIPQIVEIDNNLKTLQKCVEGYIECVYLHDGNILICNEEGKLIGLEPNRWYKDDLICGTFLIVASKDDDFGPLNDEDIEYWLDYFKDLPVWY